MTDLNPGPNAATVSTPPTETDAPAATSSNRQTTSQSRLLWEAGRPVSPYGSEADAPVQKSIDYND